MLPTPKLPRNQRLPEGQKRIVSAELLARYNAGKSIRQLCQETGYSIGRVRRLLESSGVTFRARGGSNRRV